MARAADPTEAIRTKAAAFPGVVHGTSCNQTSFRAGKAAFLFVGPGAKGQGFKAMFKLDDSLAQARSLAEAEPTRYQAGSNGWVTTRFTAEEPLPKSVWSGWLAESYALISGSSKKKKTASKKTASKKAGSKKKTATKKATKKKATRKTASKKAAKKTASKKAGSKKKTASKKATKKKAGSKKKTASKKKAVKMR